jgi:hypothetical protein
VNVFDLDRAPIRDYEHFARSFTQIRAPDIRSQVEALRPLHQFSDHIATGSRHVRFTPESGH